MTCASCERRIEKALLAVPGVLAAKVSQYAGKAEVSHEADANPQAMRAAVEKAGYTVRERPSRATPLALGIGLVLAAAYLLASSAGLFNGFPTVDSTVSYGMLLVIGLLTSVHCVAMCGGIVLSQSLGGGIPAVPAARPSSFERFKPALLYNAGRVISYAIVGALIGGLGSVLSFTEGAKAAITAAAGVFMLWLGLRMIGLLPPLPSLSKLLPAPLGALRGRMAALGSGRGPLVVGLLGGLMPCGPLQTMQLYALGTGSALAGAVSMSLFALGTVPLLLGFGAFASLLPRKFMPIMIRAGAVLVLLLGTLTIGRAAAFAGFAPPSLAAAPTGGAVPTLASASGGLGGSAGLPLLPSPAATGENPASGPVRAVIKDGVQTVVTVFGPNSYAPFIVQAGIPVRWIIRIRKEDLNGCNRSFVVPAYKIRKDLKPGDNLVEFTPTKTGIVAYSCWMGMIRSAFSVVPDLEAGGASLEGGLSAPGQDPQSALAIPGSSGGCCGANADPAFAGGRVPTDLIGFPRLVKGVQEVEVTVKGGPEGDGYSPAVIVLQRNLDAVIRFRPENLDGCNSIVYFPEYNGTLDLSKGELATPAIRVSGDFSFQCGMGMIHGVVRVVDDITKVDVAAIRRELADYRAPSGGSSCCGS